MYNVHAYLWYMSGSRVPLCPLSLRGEKVTSFISHQERGFKVTVHPKMYSP